MYVLPPGSTLLVPRLRTIEGKVTCSLDLSAHALNLFWGVYVRFREGPNDNTTTDMSLCPKIHINSTHPDVQGGIHGTQSAGARA